MVEGGKVVPLCKAQGELYMAMEYLWLWLQGVYYNYVCMLMSNHRNKYIGSFAEHFKYIFVHSG